MQLDELDDVSSRLNICDACVVSNIVFVLCCRSEGETCGMKFVAAAATEILLMLPLP